MNILILVNALPPRVIGGTEIQAFEMAKRLSERHNVIVYTRGYKNAPQQEHLHGFLVRRSPHNALRIPLGAYTLGALYEIFKQREKPDVILAMGIFGGFIGILAKRLWKIPIIASVRSEKQYREKRRLYELTTSFAVKYSDAIWVQSDTIKKEFLKAYPNDKTFVIPNGVEIDGRTAHGKNVIYVGSLHETKRKDKGVRHLIEAMKYLEGRKLVIVGDGPQKGYLESLSEGLSVEFVGNVEHSRVKDHLLKAGVFAFPAVYGEGLPNAVFEALSVGLPVVASKTAKVQGIIRDGETGFLVEPKSPEQLAARMKEILEDETLREKMGKNCLREARKYSWDTVIPKIENLFEKVVTEDNVFLEER
jgi:glycosyltransferase involved in cell wall biosynthesis